MFNYITNNLKEVLNTEKVLCIKPYRIENEKAMFAWIKVNEGVYTRIQITELQSECFFPFEPIRNLGVHLDNFLIISDAVALNRDYLEGFTTISIPNNEKYTVISATFNDGSLIPILADRKKRFDKKGGITRYNKYINHYNPKFTSYYNIDYYNKEGISIIPQLQSKLDNPKVKALIKTSDKK